MHIVTVHIYGGILDEVRVHESHEEASTYAQLRLGDEARSSLGGFKGDGGDEYDDMEMYQEIHIVETSKGCAEVQLETWASPSKLALPVR